MRVEIKGVKKAIIKIEKYEQVKIDQIKESVTEHTINIENQAKALAPVKEGNLKASIDSHFRNDHLIGIVSASADYASHVEFGTRPHKITVKDANVLSDGKNFFGKEVNHPGTRAQPFMMPSFEIHRPRFIRDINSILKRER